MMTVFINLMTSASLASICGKSRFGELVPPRSEVSTSTTLEQVEPLTNLHPTGAARKVPTMPAENFAIPMRQDQTSTAHASRRAWLPTFSLVSFLAEAQMARQNAILLLKSARLYTRLSESSSTLPIKYPKKYPSG